MNTYLLQSQQAKPMIRAVTRLRQTMTKTSSSVLIDVDPPSSSLGTVVEFLENRNNNESEK